jgi:hypothetical protein
MMALTIVVGGSTHGRGATGLLEMIEPPPSASDRRSLGYCDVRRCTQDYPSTTASLLFFFSITDQDCVVLPYIDISTSTPPMDEVVVACPQAYNNSDVHG